MCVKGNPIKRTKAKTCTRVDIYKERRFFVPYDNHSVFHVTMTINLRVPFLLCWGTTSELLRTRPCCTLLTIPSLPLSVTPVLFLIPYAQYCSLFVLPQLVGISSLALSPPSSLSLSPLLFRKHVLQYISKTETQCEDEKNVTAKKFSVVHASVRTKQPTVTWLAAEHSTQHWE